MVDVTFAHTTTCKIKRIPKRDFKLFKHSMKIEEKCKHFTTLHLVSQMYIHLKD